MKSPSGYDHQIARKFKIDGSYIFIRKGILDVYLCWCQGHQRRQSWIWHQSL